MNEHNMLELLDGVVGMGDVRFAVSLTANGSLIRCLHNSFDDFDDHTIIATKAESTTMWMPNTRRGVDQLVNWWMRGKLTDSRIERLEGSNRSPSLAQARMLAEAGIRHGAIVAVDVGVGNRLLGASPEQLVSDVGTGVVQKSFPDVQQALLWLNGEDCVCDIEVQMDRLLDASTSIWLSANVSGPTSDVVTVSANVTSFRGWHQATTQQTLDDVAAWTRGRMTLEAMQVAPSSRTPEPVSHHELMSALSKLPLSAVTLRKGSSLIRIGVDGSVDVDQTTPAVRVFLRRMGLS